VSWGNRKCRLDLSRFIHLEQWSQALVGLYLLVLYSLRVVTLSAGLEQQSILLRVRQQAKLSDRTCVYGECGIGLRAICGSYMVQFPRVCCAFQLIDSDRSMRSCPGPSHDHEPNKDIRTPQVARLGHMWSTSRTSALSLLGPHVHAPITYIFPYILSLRAYDGTSYEAYI
jgi:hypothetical protein